VPPPSLRGAQRRSNPVFFDAFTMGLDCRVGLCEASSQ